MFYCMNSQALFSMDEMLRYMWNIYCFVLYRVHILRKILIYIQNYVVVKPCVAADFLTIGSQCINSFRFTQCHISNLLFFTNDLEILFRKMYFLQRFINVSAVHAMACFRHPYVSTVVVVHGAMLSSLGNQAESKIRTKCDVQFSSFYMPIFFIPDLNNLHFSS